VFGTAVPEGFYSSLTPENLKDGLLGRLLIIESKGYGTRQKPADVEPPAELIDGIKRWGAFKGDPAAGNLSDEHPVPLKVLKTPEADARHERYCDEVHAKHKGEEDTPAAGWSRAPEKAAKLALIFACCEAPDCHPVITLAAVNWARKLTNYSTRLVLVESANVVSGSRYEDEKKRLWRCIRDGMTLAQLTRRTQRLRKRERLEILSDLEESGAIEVAKVGTETRPRTTIRKTRRTL